MSAVSMIVCWSHLLAVSSSHAELLVTADLLLDGLLWRTCQSAVVLMSHQHYSFRLLRRVTDCESQCKLIRAYLTVSECDCDPP